MPSLNWQCPHCRAVNVGDPEKANLATCFNCKVQYAWKQVLSRATRQFLRKAPLTHHLRKGRKQPMPAP